MKIVVLAGGFSPEREVSLSSGAMITNALMKNGHEVYLLDSYLGVADGEEVCFESLKEGTDLSREIGKGVPELDRLAKERKGKGYIGNRVIEICRKADVVFLALHGGAGENGQIQAVLDAYGISYTGTGYEGCLKAMDKPMAKLLMRESGILTPDWRLYTRGEPLEPFSFPCVVKPCGCGSSVGVTMADGKEQWKQALDSAFAYEDRILAEVKIIGREFSVGILGERALPAIEIIPKAGFYDYQNKYQAGMTEEICPAKLTAKEEEAMGQIALKVHRILGLGYYSRVDFLMAENGSMYCLEANTLPGMTPFSLLPQEAKAAGISYEELCEDIVRHGITLQVCPDDQKRGQ
ncbi:D-alanine--D-alanine ligase family protein [Lacrimispora indolis]|uniref:D-alanine--D-alanine ligase family protein n=1 Tax=Lacrimispora indolis TaxID=69825 RepID=UPI00045E7345|nr:D-alanine--D-alanine ligase [Lacrimispora indolis]MBE7719397.1 D-alanine--D-alanine ligase [Lacrimispora celerecrescens]